MMEDVIVSKYQNGDILEDGIVSDLKMEKK